MLISIIVPIYEVEKYIARCASSLLHQTASREYYEVIFVNDGTKDNSIGVLHSVIDFDRFSNFYLVEKENGGLSSARNYGLSFVKGDYIWFVDSDDWIEEDSVERLISLLRNDPDVLIMSQVFKNHSDGQSLMFKQTYKLVCSGIEALRLSLPNMAPMHICRRDFLASNNITFKAGILHEDAEFTPRVKFLANTCTIIDKPLYHYYMRDGSISHIVNPIRVYSYFAVLDSLSQFLVEQVRVDDYVCFSASFAADIYSLLNISTKMPEGIQTEVNDYFKNNPQLAKMMILNSNLKSKVMGLLLKWFPAKATFVYKALARVKGLL